MSENDELQLQRYLKSLPTAEPPSGLGARILARHAQRRRRSRLLAPLAVAAALALAAMLPLTLRSPSPEPTRHAAMAPDPALVEEIRSLDRRLQSTYLTAGDQASRDTLWQARLQAEARLRDGSPAPRLIHL